jgi:hypothetical protein
VTDEPSGFLDPAILAMKNKGFSPWNIIWYTNYNFIGITSKK